MVFHGGQPSCKKKTKGNSFWVHKQAISHTLIMAAPEEEAPGHSPAVNDLPESSFAGVMAQVQGHSAAAVIDMSRNDFLTQPTTKKDTSNEQIGLFHELPELLRITTAMVAMKDALEIR